MPVLMIDERMSINFNVFRLNPGGNFFNTEWTHIMAVTINSSKTLFKVNLFSLETQNITLDNGVDTDVHVLRHPGAAAIVPFLDSDTIVMIKQYRHTMADYIWEIPAGTFDFKGEAPDVCAERELLEETGFRGGRFEKIGRIFPSPGYSDEQIFVFAAFDLIADKQQLEADEVLHVHPLPFDDVLKMIDAGEIHDSKTIASLLMADRKRDRLTK